MVDIKFNSKYQIFYVTFSNVIDLDDIKYYLKKIEGFNKSHDFLDLIHDMRKADYSLEIDDIEKVFTISEKVASQFSTVRVGSIHHNAHSTAISTLIRERIDIENIEYRVYSTLEAAFEWLKVKKANQQVG